MYWDVVSVFSSALPDPDIQVTSSSTIPPKGVIAGGGGWAGGGSAAAAAVAAAAAGKNSQKSDFCSICCRQWRDTADLWEIWEIVPGGGGSAAQELRDGGISQKSAV